MSWEEDERRFFASLAAHAKGRGVDVGVGRAASFPNARVNSETVAGITSSSLLASGFFGPSQHDSSSKSPSGGRTGDFPFSDQRAASVSEKIASNSNRPSRAATLIATIGEIVIATNGRNDPAVRLAAAEAYAQKAYAMLSQSWRDAESAEPDDARDSLVWRQDCDATYADGIVARKCGLGIADHGFSLDNEQSIALAQAFSLGWSAADDALAFEAVADAARAHLKHGDAGTRDALREALARLPAP